MTDVANSNVSQDEQDLQDQCDRECEIASDTFCALLDDMDVTADEEDVSAIGMMYSLWISISYFLFEVGWNSAELSKDLVGHERMHHGQPNGH